MAQVTQAQVSSAVDLHGKTQIEKKEFYFKRNLLGLRAPPPKFHNHVLAP